MTRHDLLPVSLYYRTFFCLTALMALTVFAAQLPLGRLGLPIAMAIATAKATLILLIFMNVKYSSTLTKLFAAAGFFWLLILLFFTLSDFVFPHLGSPATTPLGI